MNIHVVVVVKKARRLVRPFEARAIAKAPGFSDTVASCDAYDRKSAKLGALSEVLWALSQKAPSP